MKAGGQTIPPDHSLPQMPHHKVVRERKEYGILVEGLTQQLGAGKQLQ